MHRAPMLLGIATSPGSARLLAMTEKGVACAQAKQSFARLRHLAMTRGPPQPGRPSSLRGGMAPPMDRRHKPLIRRVLEIFLTISGTSCTRPAVNATTGCKLRLWLYRVREPRDSSHDGAPAGPRRGTAPPVDRTGKCLNDHGLSYTPRARRLSSPPLLGKW